MLSAVRVDTPILAELIVSGDQDAVAGYYDGRAPSVYEYCTQICTPEQVEEAVLASFADFLGRVRGSGHGADLDDLLRKSTRGAAASRMRVSNARDPACRSMPELIAARANGELPHDEAAINAHLEKCRSCRQVAERLVDAEDALVRPTSRTPAEEVRTKWLLVAARGTETPSPPQPPAAEPEPAAAAEPEPAAAAEPEPEPAAEPEPAPAAEPEAAPAAEPEPAPAAEPKPPALPAAESAVAAEQLASPAEPPEPPTPQPVRVRRRSGGLVGAARRIASSTLRR